MRTQAIDELGADPGRSVQTRVSERVGFPMQVPGAHARSLLRFAKVETLLALREVLKHVPPGVREDWLGYRVCRHRVYECRQYVGVVNVCLLSGYCGAHPDDSSSYPISESVDPRMSAERRMAIRSRSLSGISSVRTIP